MPSIPLIHARTLVAGSPRSRMAWSRYLAARNSAICRWRGPSTGLGVPLEEFGVEGDFQQRLFPTRFA